MLMLPKLCGEKLAVTFSAEFIATMQVGFEPALAQAPPQPRNCEVPVGEAVNVTPVPLE
jgi:hypothetical protein